MPSLPTISILYEQDYYLWLKTTIQKIRLQQFSAVDWENLLLELESMGRSEKRTLEGLLIRLFEHLLKLAHWTTEKDYNESHWKAKICNFRKQIKKELKASPSLKAYLLEIFQESYQDAKEIISERSNLPLETFPIEPIATVEQILDENWYPTTKS
ncbi:DUF29 domain-containing protein [Chroococcus sp. FPU101]|uniref:DUF29 domain-containing protein n=1 Tax=Chroococcus sp. FPU101 TaxID=1974212 RepID=UPI001A8BFFFA|nr:DUF29 domain-containing protein [Chroococcus sp. FPU101]GFE71466.1 hypothetical protein CFPU101_40760 [Chroococcus sp. FPU101]